MKVTISNPGQPSISLEVAIPEERPGYDWLAKFLRPILRVQDFEHISVLGDDGKFWDMFVDEIGALRPDRQLNVEASERYRKAAREGKLRASIPPEEIEQMQIFGRAVLFHGRVWF